MITITVEVYKVANLPSGLGSKAADIVVKKAKAITEFAIDDRVVYSQATLGTDREYHNVDLSILVQKGNLFATR